jgi:hypothetical protein
LPSLLALTGLNVDRAYPKLGRQAADRRRSVATTLLLSAITNARHVGADALIFVGGLFDERSVSPQSVSYLVQVLDAYPGQVLIAPGADDPYDAGGVYEVTNWGSRTFVWSTAEFAASPEPVGAVVRGRANRQGWSATFPAAWGEGGVTVLVGADLPPERSASWVEEDHTRHVITSGASETQLDGVTVLAPANPGLGEPWGQAAVVTYDNSKVTSVEWVSLTTQPPAQTIEIDVAGLATTLELSGALDRAIAAAPEWSVVRMVGDLSQGVQLPSTAGYASPRGDVAIDIDGVGFAFTPPERADHTALGEFVRSVIDADADERVRHQAIALGMAALVPASDEEEGP